MGLSKLITWVVSIWDSSKDKPLTRQEIANNFYKLN